MTAASGTATPVPVVHPTSVHAKALALNLEPGDYGSVAEIGAGQGVAQWLLTVGGASGTVARTISAYDKVVSDQTYGGGQPGTRYVSRERLGAMLDVEYGILMDHLAPKREKPTRFFAFANTVSARNFKGDNEQHGWVGIRFQAAPGQQASEVILHVNLMDPSNTQQQEAMGVLGVNLIYAAMRQLQSAEAFLDGLFDGLEGGRLELDYLSASGPAFEKTNVRRCALLALQAGRATVFVFDQKGELAEPSAVLRKRAVVVERGLFEKAEPFHKAMLDSGTKVLLAEGTAFEKPPVAVLELSMRYLNGSEVKELPFEALLERIDRLRNTAPVMVTNFPETHRLTTYLRRHTQEPVRIVGGVVTLARLLDESFYADLPGSMLEGLGKMLSTNVKVYAYPMPAEVCGGALAGAKSVKLRAGASGQVNLNDLEFAAPLNHFVNYLTGVGRFVIISA